MRTICECGASITNSPPKATWYCEGFWVEMRDCPCGSTRRYTLADTLDSGELDLSIRFGTELAPHYLGRMPVEDAIDRYLVEDGNGELRASAPVGSQLWAELPASRVLVAVVLRNGTWLILPPQEK